MREPLGKEGISRYYEYEIYECYYCYLNGTFIKYVRYRVQIAVDIVLTTYERGSQL